MPKRCAAYGCRGNYTGGPYTSVVRFTTEITEQNRWIEAFNFDHIWKGVKPHNSHSTII